MVASGSVDTVKPNAGGERQFSFPDETDRRGIFRAVGHGLVLHLPNNHYGECWRLAIEGLVQSLTVTGMHELFKPLADAQPTVFLREYTGKRCGRHFSQPPNF
jgi:hypothetical protein